MTNVKQNFQVVIYWSMIIICDNPTVMRICHWPVNENSKCLLTNCQEPRQNSGPGGKMSFCRFRGGPSDTRGGPLISVAAVLHKKWLTQVVFLKFEIMGALRFAARQNLQKIESTEWENQHLSLSIQVWRWKGFNPISTSIHPYP